MKKFVLSICNLRTNYFQVFNFFKLFQQAKSNISESIQHKSNTINIIYQITENYRVILFSNIFNLKIFSFQEKIKPYTFYSTWLF